MLTHVAVQWVLEKSWVHIAACRSKLLPKVSLFPVSLRANTGIVPKWSRSHFLPQPSDSLSNRPTIRRGVIWSTDSVFEENMDISVCMALCFIFSRYLISILNWTLSIPLCTYDKFYWIKPSLHNTIDSCYSTTGYISNMFRLCLAIIRLTKVIISWGT